MFLDHCFDLILHFIWLPTAATAFRFGGDPVATQREIDIEAQQERARQDRGPEQSVHRFR
jgi:hypothetical protein